MLTGEQKERLEKLIDNEGSYFAIIRDYSGVNWGTKVLYLTRAICEPWETFLAQLDKLYISGMATEESKAQLEFMCALQAINNLCFNNFVKYGVYGVRPACYEFFGNVERREAAHHQAFTTLIQFNIKRKITELKKQHPESALQSDARTEAESKIPGNTFWRVLADLPIYQIRPVQGNTQNRSLPAVLQWLHYKQLLSYYEGLNATQAQVLVDNFENIQVLTEAGIAVEDFLTLELKQQQLVLSHTDDIVRLVSASISLNALFKRTKNQQTLLLSNSEKIVQAIQAEEITAQALLAMGEYELRVLLNGSTESHAHTQGCCGIS